MGSSLLQLPAEIRVSILQNLLGDRFVHLKHLYNDGYFQQLRGNDEIPPFGACRHIVCCNSHSEEAFYEDYNSENFSLSDVKAPRTFLIEAYGDRHYACTRKDHIWEHHFRQPRQCNDPVRADALDVRILGVCRQFYIDGSEVLWRTNTWAFDDAYTFYVFLSSLSPLARNMISKVHISVIWQWCQIRSWRHSFHILPFRHGYSRLEQLTINFDCKESLTKDPTYFVNSVFSEGFRELCRLPLRTVRVFLDSPKLGEMRTAGVFQLQYFPGGPGGVSQAIGRPLTLMQLHPSGLPGPHGPPVMNSLDDTKDADFKVIFEKAQHARLGFCRTFEEKINQYVKHDRARIAMDEQKLKTREKIKGEKRSIRVVERDRKMELEEVLDDVGEYVWV